MNKIFTPILLALLLTGCGTLIPKRVELFQDKVKEMPVARASEREVQRQAAQRAAQASASVLLAVVTDGAGTNIVQPAGDAAKLSDSVSRSLGPPLKPSSEAAPDLSRRLDTTIAKLNDRMDSFRDKNDENAGKKIESTGMFQIPYFLWIGLVGVFLFIGLIVMGVLWSFLKMYALSNPPVALGVNAISAGGKFATKALSQLVKGGETFKDAVVKEVSDPALQAKVKELFRVHHQTAQDQDVQAVIKELTK
jgi:hypothetical protein